MIGGDRWGRVWTGVAFAVALVSAVVPLLVTYDLPLVDLPGHLATIDVWNRFDHSELGYSRYYEVNISLVPYWTYYWGVKLFALVLPIRVANKMVVLLLFVGLFFGFRAFLRAHRRPEVLAAGAGIFCWSWSVMFGFLAYAVGVGLLLWAYALAARLADARPWPSRALIAGNVAIGFALFLTHPVLMILWLVGILVYLPNRWALVALPSVALLGWSTRRAGPTGDSFAVQGQFLSPKKNLWLAYDHQLNGWFQNLSPFIWAALLATVVLAWCLVKRTPERGRNPYLLFGALVVTYLALPLNLQQPTDLALMNARIVTAMVMVGLACVPAGRLPGWRSAVVIAPVLAMTLVYHAELLRVFHQYDVRNRDFYQVVQHLPMDPAVATLIYDKFEYEHGPVYRRYAGYVQLERGGYNGTFFRRSASHAKFPADYRPGPQPFPPIDVVTDFQWTRDGSKFDYYLTRREPGTAFVGRPEVELVVQKGEWKLWKRRR